MKKRLSSLLLTFYFCYCGNAQHFQLPVDLEKQVDEFYQEWSKEGYPGGAVGIVHKGELIFSKGYGLASLEHNIPFTPETISDVGSVSKQLTCFGIVLLSQRGKLKLDDDIRKYLPEIPDFEKKITIRHLMNHTSGIREIYATEGIRGYRTGDGILQKDALQLVVNSKELNFSPGDQYLYCNTGYMLLADLISRVTDQVFETWMQENVFRPIGMNHTYIMDRRGEVFPNCADSYEKHPNGGFVKIYDNSTVQGAGGVYTTIPDLVRWLKNLRDPETGGKDAIQDMLQRGVLNNGDTLNYALGLTVDTYHGYKMIQHTGSSAGYRALISFFPELDLGIVIKTNCPSVNRGELVDLLLGKTPTEEDSPQVTAPAYSPNPEELQTLTGYYFSDELETAFRLQVENGLLIGRHFRHGRFALSPMEKDKFTSEGDFSCTVEFIRNPAGAVTGIRLSSGGVMNLWLTKIE